jgi:hypothetical protein
MEIDGDDRGGIGRIDIDGAETEANEKAGSELAIVGVNTGIEGDDPVPGADTKERVGRGGMRTLGRD